MRVDAFDFDLPNERIALRPARPRDAARMLVVEGGGAMTDAGVGDLPRWLRPGDCLVPVGDRPNGWRAYIRNRP